MIPATISTFIEALVNPSVSLCKALGGTLLEFGGGRTPEVCRLTDFAETTVECACRRYLLAMPLRAEARKAAVRLAARMRCIESPHLTDYRVLKEAFVFTDSQGQIRSMDLVAETLPEGRPLSEVLREGLPHPGLCDELDRMQLDFARIGFRHNNLKPDNLILTPNGRLVTVRCHRGHFCPNHETDVRAFARLRKRIQALGEEPRPLPAPDEEQPSEYRGNLFDGLIRVESGGKFGYVDDRGRCVIKPRYLEAEDFREGRAVVQNEKGRYGLIDKRGKYVIRPHYEAVEYDDMEGISLVMAREKWAMVDYCGRFLTDFGPKPALRQRVPERQA